MKISKKIVSIGSIAAIIAPIAVSASCSNQTQNEKVDINIKIKKPEIKFYGKYDGGTPNKNGKMNYGTFRIHIPELGISYQGYNKIPFKAENINTSPVEAIFDGVFQQGNLISFKRPTVIWDKNKNLNSTKGIGHDVKTTITLKPGPGISSINGKKEVQYTYTVNKDRIYGMRNIPNFPSSVNDEKKKEWISQARKAIEDRLNFKDPNSLEKGEHLYTFENVTQIPEFFLYEENSYNKIKILPGDIDFSNVVSIGNKAFYNLLSLPENINFSSVTEIGDEAFSNLQYLPENINFSNVNQISDGAFDSLKTFPTKAFDWSKITRLTGFSAVDSIPENIDFSNVTSIGYGAFTFLKHLPENISFPNVTTIEGFAFQHLISLPEKFDLSNVTTIEESAFDDLKSLPENIHFNHAITYDKFKEAFRQVDSKYDESWFNTHRNPATTTTP